MTKIFTFGKNNNYSSNYSFQNNSKPTDYSSIIDDIILADIVKKNDYLFKKSNKEPEDIILTGCPKFNNAAKFITNFKIYTKKYKIPYLLNTMYTLSDGTPVIFYDDEFQIGFDTYKYSDFSNLAFLNSLNAKKKDIIINIYTKGTANININIL